MKENGKRITAALLAFIMVSAMLPAAASVAGERGIQLGASGIGTG